MGLDLIGEVVCVRHKQGRQLRRQRGAARGGAWCAGGLRVRTGLEVEVRRAVTMAALDGKVADDLVCVFSGCCPVVGLRRGERAE